MLAEIIIFFILAAFILFRLYISLGKEDYIKIDDLIKKKSFKNTCDKNIKIDDTFNKVNISCLDEVKTILKEIKKNTPFFSIDRFIEKTNIAFEDILRYFYTSDLENLKLFVTKEIYDLFLKKIEDSKIKQNVYNHNLISIKKNEIIGTSIENDEVTFKIYFLSEQINFISNQKGDIISGDSVSSEVEDIWSFKKNIKSKNPIWLLSDVGYKI